MYTTRAYGSKTRRARHARRIPTPTFAVECQDDDDDDDDDNDNNTNTQILCRASYDTQTELKILNFYRLSNFCTFAMIWDRCYAFSKCAFALDYFDIMFINDFITLPVNDISNRVAICMNEYMRADYKNMHTFAYALSSVLARCISYGVVLNVS
uniref:Uncharacterized protein n=1 Tax=Glossina pallidipes TaxID=7398 RepID=A0A1A9ZIR1_GLOPL